jgi:hypothetical protein
MHRTSFLVYTFIIDLYVLSNHVIRLFSSMLEYGCTRLEIGVQSVYEDVARDTNR